jgi:hypothetical protein
MHMRVTDWIDVIGSDGHTYLVIEYSECADPDDDLRRLSKSGPAAKSFQLVTGHGVHYVDENTWRIPGTSITLRRIYPV